MTSAEDALWGLRQSGLRLERYVEEFLELSNRVSWHETALGACFLLGLDDEVIRCDLPVSDFPLIELINLVFFLNGSDEEVEEIPRPHHPTPAGTRRISPAHPTPRTSAYLSNGSRLPNPKDPPCLLSSSILLSPEPPPSVKPSPVPALPARRRVPALPERGNGRRRVRCCSGEGKTTYLSILNHRDTEGQHYKHNFNVMYNVIVMNLVATHSNCTSPMDYISHHALHSHIPVHHYTNHTAVTIHSFALIASPHLHLIHPLTYKQHTYTHPLQSLVFPRLTFPSVFHSLSFRVLPGLLTLSPDCLLPALLTPPAYWLSSLSAACPDPLLCLCLRICLIYVALDTTVCYLPV